MLPPIRIGPEASNENGTHSNFAARRTAARTAASQDNAGGSGMPFRLNIDPEDFDFLALSAADGGRSGSRRPVM